MSSTNRGGRRVDYDYYRTPLHTVREMIGGMLYFEPYFMDSRVYPNRRILDPCAGGDPKHPIMPYPAVFNEHSGDHVTTIDIRKDSSAEYQLDYFHWGCGTYDLILGNPPYDLAKEYIEESLNNLGPDGYLIFLLRLSFYGSQKRKAWWQFHMPKYTIVHSHRPSFTATGTDSSEYAHFVWQKDLNVASSRLIVV